MKLVRMNFAFLIKYFLILNCFSAIAQADLWTAFTGPSTMANIAPVYGTLGVPAAGNKPGTRQGATTWADNSGNLWLFGGILNANYGTRSDLWKYNTTTHQWTWVHGPDTAYSPPVYGVQGVPASSNEPGCRLRSGGWTDNNGDLWLYSGINNYYVSDDLWKYSVSTNEWTWIKGSNSGLALANFGTQGVASVSNTPGARSDFVCGTDASGNLWLFGGSTIASGSMADLWRYDISTNNWTWMSGSSIALTNGNYTQLGVASPSIYPGARYAASGGVDNAGNFWVFGGNGYPQVWYGMLNDLWKYNFSSGLWTWVGGSNQSGDPGNYGIKKVSSASNQPPSRFFATMTTDNLGNLWLFGGNDGTYLSSTATATHSGNFNDLWRFSPSNGDWTWIAGANTCDQTGIYGTIGLGVPANRPGARCIHQMWKENNGNIWIFGGSGGITTFASSGWYADLWRYSTCNPPTSILNPIPLLTVANSSTTCLGEAVTLSVTGGSSYTLNSNSSLGSTVFNGSYMAVTPTLTTTYTITVSNVYNCSAQAVTTVSVSQCLSIEINKADDFQIYPNPFSKDITVVAPQNKNTKVTIFNVTGKMVFSGDLNAQKLDLEWLDPGLYFMHLAAYKDSPSIKIIKE